MSSQTSKKYSSACKYFFPHKKKDKPEFLHRNLGFSVEVFYCIAGKAKLQFVSIFFKRKPAFMKERYVCAWKNTLCDRNSECQNYIAYHLGIFSLTGMLFHFEMPDILKDDYTSSSIPTLRSSKHERIQFLDTSVVLSWRKTGIYDWTISFQKEMLHYCITCCIVMAEVLG